MHSSVYQITTEKIKDGDYLTRTPYIRETVRDLTIVLILTMKNARSV